MDFDCAYCRRLGLDCEGANLISLKAVELLDFCKSRKNHLGWSNQKLAEESGVPKGTIDSLFSGGRVDFKYETIRPIVTAFTGMGLIGSYCPEKESKSVEEKIGHQEEIIKHLECDKISLQKSWQTLLNYMNGKSAESQKRFEFMKGQVDVRNRAIAFLVSLHILFIVIIGFILHGQIRLQPCIPGQSIVAYRKGNIL